MSIDVKELAGRHASNFPVGVPALIGVANVLREQGLLPKRFSKEKTLQTEDNTQIALSVFRYNQERYPGGELIRATWQDVLDYSLKKADIDMDIEIPEIDLSEQELRKPIRDIRGWNIRPMGFLFPKEFQGKEGENILLKVLTALGMTGHYIDSSLPEVEEQVGWSTVENTNEAMHLNASPKQLKEFLAKQGRTIIGKNKILTLAVFKRVTTGSFPYENTITFLANNSLDGHQVGDAHFDSDGRLHVLADLTPGYQHPFWGVHSLGVKK